MKRFKDWLQENMGSGPYIGDCKSSDDYQVFGSCSDRNTKKNNDLISSGKKNSRPNKKLSYKFKEYVNEQEEQQTQSSYSLPIVKKKKWKATKDQILQYWRGIRDDIPIAIHPISYDHTGSTYGEDGIRLTGSAEFITSMLPRLKELLVYESPNTKLSLVYRETESPSKLALGISKTSYVFYLQVKERGHGKLKKIS